MKQEDFDKKVDALAEQVSGLDTKLDGEADQIAEIVSGYKAEIARLKESQGDNIDTSRLDELSNSLDTVGTRIGGLVDPSPTTGEDSPPSEGPTDSPARGVEIFDGGGVPTPKDEMAQTADESSSEISPSEDEN